MKYKRSYLALCIILIALCTFQLAGCGSAGSGSDENGSSTPTPVEPVLGEPNESNTTIKASSASLKADDSEITTISLTVLDADGNSLPNETVAFASSLGSWVSKPPVLTDANGVASADLKSAVPGSAAVTVAVGGFTKTVNVTFTAVPDVFALTASQISVQTDNSDSSTITATVLDKNRVPVSGIVVAFKTVGEDGKPAGQINAASMVTDGNGEASIVFSSGTVEQVNQVVTIEATVPGINDPKSVPIHVTGTTIVLTSSGSTYLEIGGVAKDTLTITLADASGRAINNTTINVTAEPEGKVILTPAAGYAGFTTDISGVLKVDVTGASTGVATVTAQALGAIASELYSVGGVGAVFGIVMPSEDPFGAKRLDSVGIASGAITFADSGTADTITASGGAFALFTAGERIMVDGTVSNNGVYTISSIDGTSAVLTLSDADSIADEAATAATVTNGTIVKVAAPAQSNVVFAATLGTWDGGTSPVVSKPVVDGFVSAVFSSSLAGLATIQVHDQNDPSTMDISTIALSASSQEAAKIVLQSIAYTVQTSVGVTYTTTLTARVTTVANQAVGGAPVYFSILDPVGGGEKISPVVVFTNESGFANATFTSGSVPTNAQGMTLSACVVGSAVTPSNIKIVIGGTAGSVFIGRGSRINVLNPTTYALPMSVLVADSSGAGIEGQEVSLTVWPITYSTGGWYEVGEGKYSTYISGIFFNEDVNENLILDPGEDVNFDGALTPPNSAGGALDNGDNLGGQITVITGENGVADFNLVYLKGSAVWITDRVRASTVVQGTEISTSLNFNLPFEKSEGQNGYLDDSPWPITLTVAAGGSVSYPMPAFEGSVQNAYSASSPYSTINDTTGVYTFDAAGLVAGTYWDYVTISYANTTVIPIRIVVQ